MRRRGWIIVLPVKILREDRAERPQVVNAWMNSETHRGNILEESYEYLATGYAAGGAYGTNYCQNFLGDWINNKKRKGGIPGGIPF